MIRGALIAAAFLCAANAFATPGPDPANESAQAVQVVQQEGIEVAATFEGRAVLGEPIFLLLSVRNAGTGKVTLQNLKIEAIGLLSRVHRDTCEISFNDHTLSANESVRATCTLKPSTVPREVFLYRQDRFRILARAKLASRTEALPLLLSIRLAMPELAVVYGALFGTMLLIMFSASFTYLRALPDPPSSFSELRAKAPSYLMRLPIRAVLSIVRVFLRTVQGGTVAVILIVLSRTTTEIGAPVAVRVDDFWGGLLIGIFSVPLAGWLAKKLGLATDGAGTSTSESSTRLG